MSARVSEAAGGKLVAEQDPPRRPSLRAVLGCLLVGLASLLAVSAGLDAWLPWPTNNVVAVKLAALSEGGAAIDTIFVGSSLTYRHVDPARFDELTAAAGRPTHGFNLGAPGMGLIETHWLLRRLADEQALPNLRWLLPNPHSPGWDLPASILDSDRMVAWHDAASTWLALCQVAAAELPFERRVELSLNHLQSFGFHRFRLGTLGRLLSRALLGTAASRAEAERVEREQARRMLGPDGNGFFSLDDALASADEVERQQLLDRRDSLLSRRNKYLSALDRLGRGRAVPGDPGAAIRELLGAVAQACRELGGRVILFDSPTVQGRHGLFLQGQSLELFDGAIEMSDPASQPGLFALERRFDWNHLDAEGADLFTRTLAEGFLDLERAPAAEGQEPSR